MKKLNGAEFVAYIFREQVYFFTLATNLAILHANVLVKGLERTEAGRMWEDVYYNVQSMYNCLAF